MSAAPTTDIPLTQIPGELRRLRDEVEHFRQQHALEFTRAEAAERRAKKAEQSASDWQGIALHNGYEAADARLMAARARLELDGVHGSWANEVASDCAEIGRLTADRDVLVERLKLERDEIEQYRNALRDIASEFECRVPRLENIREHLTELLQGPLGVDCDTCDGAGSVYDEQPYGDPSARDGYGTRNVECECPGVCFDGRRPR